MANIKSTREKPKEKPYPEFPLFAHNNGSWCRKIRGRIYSFGPWEDPEAALKKHNEEYPSLKAGLPVPERLSGHTVESVCVKFLREKELLLKSGDIHQRWFDELTQTSKQISERWGRNRPIDSLTFEEFSEISSELRAKYSPEVAKNQISRIRQIINFGTTAGLIKVNLPVRFLKTPSKRSMRKHRSEQPKKLWTAAQYRKLLSKARPNMRAMLYLAINGGMHNSDVSELPKSAVDLKRLWIDFPRPKTYIDRLIPLWPETVKAIQDHLNDTPWEDDLLFITKYGRPFTDSSIGHEFRKLRDDCGFEQGSFIWSRHTFQTVGENRSCDSMATKAVMGHVDDTISDAYREAFYKKRLRRVTDEVRKWLKPEKVK